MKNKKILAIGLCGAICLSIAGVTYASALASDTPKVSTSETGNTSSADILYQDTDGGQISVDGKNWVAEADYEKNNAAPDVQWWTADEYEVWAYRHKIQAVRRIIITLKTYFLSSWQIFTCHILFFSKYLTACSLFFAISSRRLSKLSNIFSGRRNSCSSSFSFLPYRSP